MVLPDRFGCGSTPQRVCARCRRQLPTISRQNYYQLLGVSSDVTQEALEFAFMQRARAMQASSPSASVDTSSLPAVNQSDDADGGAWAAVTVAYDVLTDPGSVLPPAVGRVHRLHSAPIPRPVAYACHT